MRPPTRPWILGATAVAAIAALPVGSAGFAIADEAPLVHTIFAQPADAPDESTGRAAFAAAAEHYRLTPVELVDVPLPPAPRAGDGAHTGELNAQKLAFGEALRDLDAAANEVAATGGAGLSTEELSTLYLYRGMATARADWNAPANAAPTDARTHAFDDYMRAATLAPARVLDPRELPPEVVADFHRALDVVHHRARGTLTVKGPADAQVSLDGAPVQPIAGGVTFHDVVYGEHLLRVEQLGFAPWGTAAPLGQPTLEIDVPARAPLSLDDATAAAHARRMGARFALVAEPRGGRGATLELRLVDTGSGQMRDAVQVSISGQAEQIDAAVMRLDEEARRAAIENPSISRASAGVITPILSGGEANPLGAPLLMAAPPAKARFREDPAAWTRDHWPLLTAIAVVALTSIVLSAVVDSDR
jgi:hypothetical protein